MRIPVGCMQCMEEHFEAASFPMIDNINEKDIYEVTCEHGHKSYIYVQNEKYDILFTLAVQALSDGYYREAVLNFTSSLERFYEFSIKLMLQINKVPKETINSTFKNVLKQSERELGAYAALYLFFRKKPAKLLSETARGYRNRVVHMGITPTYNDAVDYGQKVHNIIKSEHEFFQKKHFYEFIKFTQDRLANLTPPKGQKTSRYSITSSIISYIESDYTLEEMVAYQKDLNLKLSQLTNIDKIGF